MRMRSYPRYYYLLMQRQLFLASSISANPSKYAAVFRSCSASNRSRPAVVIGLRDIGISTLSGQACTDLTVTVVLLGSRLGAGIGRPMVDGIGRLVIRSGPSLCLMSFFGEVDLVSSCLLEGVDWLMALLLGEVDLLLFLLLEVPLGCCLTLEYSL